MDEWFEPVEALPNARARVIFFPHAGSQPQAYFKWSKLLAPNVETFVASYPERGLRARALAPTSFREQVNAMVTALENDGIDVPYALFGHSYGALVAFEVAREISRRNLVLPLHLFVSSCCSPIQQSANSDLFSSLSDEDLYAVGVEKGWFGTASISSSDEAALRASRLAGMRHLKLDLAHFEAFVYDATTRLPLEHLVQFGATVIRGAQDPGVPPAALGSWLEVFAGGTPTALASNQGICEELGDTIVCEVHEASKPNGDGHCPTLRTVDVVAPGSGHFYHDTHPDILRSLILVTLDDIHRQLPRAVVHGPPLLDYLDVKYDSVLHDVVQQCAQNYPDRTAIIDEHNPAMSMSYAELEAEATGLAIWLHLHGCARPGANPQSAFRTVPAEGIARGSCWPVAVLLPQDSFYASLNLAILKLGGALMPFYDNYNDSLVVQLLETTSCEVAFASAEFAARFPQGDGLDGFELVNQFELSVDPTDPTHPPRRKKLFVLDPNNRDLRLAIRALGQDSVRVAHWAQHQKRHCTAQDCAMLSFTSGTTGAPKAIIVSHAATIRCFLMRYHTVPYLPPPAVEVEAIHIFFAWEVLRPLLLGHTALLLQKRTLMDPPSLVRVLQKHRVSRLMVTASLTKNMLELVPTQMRALGANFGLRNWQIMGEVLPRSTVRAWQATVPDTNLVNIYSTWESLDVSQIEYGAPMELQRVLEDAGEPIVASHGHGHSIDHELHLREVRRQDHGDLAKFALCGQAYPGICVFVVDNFSTLETTQNTSDQPAKDQSFDYRHGDSGTFSFGGHPLQAVGVYGRVVIAGTSLADGYCGDAAKTAERFHRCRLSDLPGGKALVASRRALLAQYHTSPLAQAGGVEAAVDAGLQDVDPEVTIYDSGDNGRLLRDGSLQLRGRDDGTVKIRGYKVPLVMVEKAFTDLDAVSGCVILPVPVPDNTSTDYLIAYVVPSDVASTASEAVATQFGDAVLAKAATSLPTYMAPRYIFALPKLPLRPGNGKLDIKALPRPNLPSVVSGNGHSNTDLGGTLSIEDVQRHASSLTKVMAIVGALLGLEEGQFGPDDNFFAIGGHSLLAAQLAIELTKHFGPVHSGSHTASASDDTHAVWSITAVEIFQYPTPRAMAEACTPTDTKGDSRSAIGSTPSASIPRSLEDHAGHESLTHTPDGLPRVVVVGMAGIFPGASDIHTFWQNVCQGVDSLSTFTADQLREKGVSEEVLGHPNWVRAGQVVADADKFDGYFWGLQPHEVLLLDPQQRLFLQTAYHALEDAGAAFFKPPADTPNIHEFRRMKQRTGVYAACGIDGYLIHHLDGGGLKTPLDPAKTWTTEVGNEKDYISTRVSHQLNLGGASFTVNSACSSGLVAVAQALSSIRAGQLDAAVAGASSLTFPNFGYLYNDGLPASRDGRVRPFDDSASGTVFGDAVGAVVLKRMDLALRDGDRIYAEIGGFSVNNDGNEKAGYSAPNASAQARAIVEAREMAGVSPLDVGYIEAHATATHVGDAIEVQGLRTALKKGQATSSLESGVSSANVRTALGSVKGNIGHANAAAGVTGLIKTLLCVYHDMLTPTAHFTTINRKLEPLLKGTPMFIQTRCEKWSSSEAATGRPLHAALVAGVSSFGVGGTNCHMVIREFSASTAARLQTLNQDSSASVAPAETVSLNKGSITSPLPIRLPVLRQAAQALLASDLPALLPVSAKTVTALASNLKALGQFLHQAAQHSSRNGMELIAPQAVLHTLCHRREHYRVRACVGVDIDAVLVRAAAACEPQHRAPGQSIVSTMPFNVDALHTAWLLEAGTALLARCDRVETEASNHPQTAQSTKPRSWTTLQSNGEPSIGLMFSGQGAEYVSMGRDLYQSCRAFRVQVDRLCSAAFDSATAGEVAFTLRGHRGMQSTVSGDSVHSVQEADDSIGGASITQPVVTLLQLSIAAMLQNIVFSGRSRAPALIAGHSLGEFAALSSAGVLQGVASSDQGATSMVCDGDDSPCCAAAVLQLVRARGIATDTLARDDAGMMAVVLALPRLESFLQTEKLSSDIALAVSNSNLYNVVAGSAAALDTLAVVLKAHGVQHTRLRVKRAFHSTLMSEAAVALQRDYVPQYLAPELHPPLVPTFSSLVGGALSTKKLAQSQGGDGTKPGSPGPASSSEFAYRHMMQAVQWRRVCSALLGIDSATSSSIDGGGSAKPRADIMVEIGPGDVLCKLFERNVRDAEEAGFTIKGRPVLLSTVPSAQAALRHGMSSHAHFHATVATLWECGACLNWAELFSLREMLPASKSSASSSPLNFIIPVTLPGYQFDKRSFWVNPGASIYVQGGKAPGALPSKYSTSVQISEQDRQRVLQAPRSRSTASVVPLRSPQGLLVRFTGRTFLPRLRLYGFPMAGGSSRLFDVASGWRSAGAAGTAPIEVVAVELPGRGDHVDAGEIEESSRGKWSKLPECNEDDTALIEAIASEVLEDLRIHPVEYFAFVGLSMGSLLATLVLHHVEQALQGGSSGHANSSTRGDEPRCVGLVVAGRHPVVPYSRTSRESAGQTRATQTRTVEDCDLADEDPAFGSNRFSIDVMREQGLVPEAKLASPVWREMFLPLLQSDLATDSRMSCHVRALAREVGRATTQPVVGCSVAQLQLDTQHQVSGIISCPVLNFCGVDDPASACERAGEWAAVTSSSYRCSVHFLPGDHSFLSARAADILEISLREFAVFAPSLADLPRAVRAAEDAIVARTHINQHHRQGHVKHPMHDSAGSHISAGLSQALWTVDWKHALNFSFQGAGYSASVPEAEGPVRNDPLLLVVSPKHYHAIASGEVKMGKWIHDQLSAWGGKDDGSNHDRVLSSVRLALCFTGPANVESLDTISSEHNTQDSLSDSVNRTEADVIRASWEFVKFLQASMTFAETSSADNVVMKDIMGLEIIVVLPADSSTIAGAVAGASKCVEHESSRLSCTRVFVDSRSSQAMTVSSSDSFASSTDDPFRAVKIVLSHVSKAASAQFGQDFRLKIQRAPGRASKHRSHTLWRCSLSRLRASAVTTDVESPVLPEPALRFFGTDDFSASSSGQASHDGTNVSSGADDSPVLLLTGGTGALGSVLVNWLLDFHGVPTSSVVVLSRRRGPQTHPRGVRVISVDICDAQDVERSSELQQLAPQVAGVFHLAGALQDGILMNLTSDDMGPVLKPKFAIFKLLRALAVFRDLSVSPEQTGGDTVCTAPWVVAFSSSTSLLGYPAQTNYAAGNGMLDQTAQFATQRCVPPHRTIPTLASSFAVVNWGPWADVGMARIGTKAYRQSVAHGEIPMSNEESLKHLNIVLQRVMDAEMDNESLDDLRHSTVPLFMRGFQFMIARVDWEKSYWKSNSIPIRTRTTRPDIFSGGQDEHISDVETNEGGFSNVSTEGPGASVEAFFKTRLSAWLPEESLATHGVDSLDEVQLRNEFEKQFAGVRAPLGLFSQQDLSLRNVISALAELLEKAKST